MAASFPEEVPLTAQRGPRGSYPKGIKRRASILDAAVQVFGAYGSGGTLRQIAELAGISPAAVGVHFGSKAELLDEVLRLLDRQLPVPRRMPSPAEQSRSVPDQMGIVDRFREALAEQMALQTTDPALLRLYLRLATEATAPSHPAHDFVVQQQRRRIEAIADQLRAAVAAGELAALSEDRLLGEARGILAVIEGVQMQWLLDRRTKVPELVGSYLDQVVNRLRPRPGEK